MATHDFTAVGTRVSQVLESTGQGNEEHAAPSYRAPQLFRAGSAIELVQGTYGPYNDISGYYTYSE